jgi:hypothetical protein
MRKKKGRISRKHAKGKRIIASADYADFTDAEDD